MYKRSDFMRIMLRMVVSRCIIIRMMTQKAYKFRFDPTPEQERQLAIEFGNARFVWNHALNMRSKAYKRRGEKLNYVGLNKHMTALKKTTRFDWLNQSTACVLTQKLIDLDTAFKNFFKYGAKYPRFKKKLHAQSIRFQLDQRQIERTYAAGEKLKLPKLGEINVRWSQIPNGTPKMATVSKTASGKYFVSFSCEVEQMTLPKTGKSVGIDIGIKDVIVTSDGFYSGSPKFTYRYQRKLRQAQRSLSRKTKGSNRWHNQRIVVARIHEKISNSRRDFLHKLTAKIVIEYDEICIEDLNVKSMVKNRKLSKAVSDVGMFELKRQLIYKANWYGKSVIEIDRWYPSSKTCSKCGQIHDMPLSKRVMSCSCGLDIDRDYNAAINILKAGMVLRGASYQPYTAAA
jgi:putative transposase